MKQQIHLYSKRILFTVLFLSILSLSSCTVTFIPSFDSKISEQTETTSKAVDRFYLMMLETTVASNNGRDFSNFAEDYIDIEVELNSLLNKNKIRPLNENSTRICEVTLELWQKYKEVHKSDNTLSDGLIRLNRQTFDELFYAMQVAEKGKEVLNKLPQ